MQEQVSHFPLLIFYIRVVVSQPEGENNQENQFQISSEELFDERSKNDELLNHLCSLDCVTLAIGSQS